MQAQAAAGTQITTDVNWTIGFLVSHLHFVDEK